MGRITVRMITVPALQNNQVSKALTPNILNPKIKICFLPALARILFTWYSLVLRQLEHWILKYLPNSSSNSPRVIAGEAIGKFSRQFLQLINNSIALYDNSFNSIEFSRPAVFEPVPHMTCRYVAAFHLNALKWQTVLRQLSPTVHWLQSNLPFQSGACCIQNLHHGVIPWF